MRLLTDYPTFQAAIDDTPEGGVLVIPAGQHIFEKVVISRSITLRGEVAQSNNTSHWNTAGWGAASLDRDWGSVLLSTATDGIAIDATGTAYAALHLENLVVRGAAVSANDVIGVALGAMGVYNAYSRWQHVTLANFKTGLKCVECYDGAFFDLLIHGCDTGIVWQNCNTLAAFYLSMGGVRVGMVLQDATGNTVRSGQIQAVTETGVVLNTAHENIFDNLYFENPSAQAAIVVESGNRNEFLNCHLGTAGDAVILGGSGNYLRVGNGHLGTITLAGSQNRAENATPARLVLDPDAWWSVSRGLQDIGSAQTLVAETLTFGGQRRGALALRHGDLVLEDSTGKLWKVKVNEQGSLFTESVD